MADSVPLVVPDGLWEEDDAEAVVSAWLYEEGDCVTEGRVICELMVEKVSFDIEAPASGILKIVAKKEVSVSRGDLLAQIEA
ncbi:lipoyl domain-containing protein [Parasphingopyxis marina]|uniref:Biotin attachment protein n=1 Tax=Parasphingopyxis marina TaxID=2761622 RepID=A0A842HU70_9SPHN|nr:lipoyl domain-containing protein [Parasphingopyxis marina]MBC2776626.1 biotin attachment protein [Parasphingopyxis marina]